jgi:ubiquinone/menaquinone biosynthesis C-methylase UbiE
MNSTLNYDSVNRAFTKQAEHYDTDDLSNPILTAWRKQVYAHVNKFLKPNSRILEINAGTGIDALYFVKQGHRVHATDISDGMIKKIKSKIADHSISEKLTCQQCSYEDLDQIKARDFDYIFSNFGGLNCVDDLSKVTKHFSSLLRPGGMATLVIMPPVSLWEWLWVFKGNWKSAFRRLRKGGTIARVEGEHFQTYYHSASEVAKADGKSFEIVSTEGIGSLSPPPSSIEFVLKFPRLYWLLQTLDSKLRYVFPFNRWADHVIVTLQRSTK